LYKNIQFLLHRKYNACPLPEILLSKIIAMYFENQMKERNILFWPNAKVVER